jgi:hypothetical protein
VTDFGKEIPLLQKSLNEVEAINYKTLLTRELSGRLKISIVSTGNM